MADDETIRQAAQTKQSVNIRTDVNYNTPAMRAAFGAAARGEKISNATYEQLIEGMTRKDVTLIQGRSQNSLIEFADDVKPAFKLFLKQNYGTLLTRAEKEDLDNRIGYLSKLTDIPANFIKHVFEKQAYKILGLKFSTDPISSTDREFLQLGPSLMQKADYGALDTSYFYVSEKTSQQIIAQNAFIRTGMDNFFKKYPQIDRKKFMTEFNEQTLTSSSQDISQSFNLIKHKYAALLDTTAAKAFIVLPDLYQDEAEAWRHIFPLDDQPIKAPPWTDELFKLLTSIHESEHTMVATFPLNIKNTPFDLAILMGEIDADYAVINSIKEFAETPEQRKELIDYWFAWRNVRGFGDPMHNSSYHLRAREAGREIDLEEFQASQMSAFKKAARYIDFEAEIKFKDVRGAIQHMLKDNEQKQFLTPDERDILRQIDEDFETIGYTANPNYPRPPTPPSQPELSIEARTPRTSPQL